MYKRQLGALAAGGVALTAAHADLVERAGVLGGMVDTAVHGAVNVIVVLIHCYKTSSQWMRLVCTLFRGLFLRVGSFVLGQHLGDKVAGKPALAPALYVKIAQNEMCIRDRSGGTYYPIPSVLGVWLFPVISLLINMLLIKQKRLSKMNTVIFALLFVVMMAAYCMNL